jgi:hypothetical protein
MRRALVPHGTGQTAGAPGGQRMSSCTGEDTDDERGIRPWEMPGTHGHLLSRLVPALVQDGYIVHSLSNGGRKTGGEATAQGGAGGSQGGSIVAASGGAQRKKYRDVPHTLCMGINRLDASHPHHRLDLKAACTATLPYAFLCFTGARDALPPLPPRRYCWPFSSVATGSTRIQTPPRPQPSLGGWWSPTPTHDDAHACLISLVYPTGQTVLRWGPRRAGLGEPLHPLPLLASRLLSQALRSSIAR